MTSLQFSFRRPLAGSGRGADSPSGRTTVPRRQIATGLSAGGAAWPRGPRGGRGSTAAAGGEAGAALGGVGMGMSLDSDYRSIVSRLYMVRKKMLRFRTILNDFNGLARLVAWRRAVVAVTNGPSRHGRACPGHLRLSAVLCRLFRFPQRHQSFTDVVPRSRGWPGQARP